MDRLLTGVAGLILLLIALPLTLIGLGLFLYGVMFMSPCAPTAPICRSVGLVGPLIGALVIATGIVYGAVGIGIIRSNRSAQLAGLIISILGGIGAACVALTAFKPLGYVVRDPALGLEPFYNSTSIAIAASVLPYSVALIALFLAIRHGRRARA